MTGGDVQVKRYRRCRLLLFVGCVLGIAGRLGYQTVVRPDVQFLWPAARGQWIVHPNPPPGEREALFVHRFGVASRPDHYAVRVRAMRECEITLNGTAVAKVSPANWKSAVDYDLGSALQDGQNEIRIRVFNLESPPALLVEGEAGIRSDERWRVVMPVADGTEVTAAVADRDERFLDAKPNVMRASRWFPIWAAMFAAYSLFILYALLPARLNPWVATVLPEKYGRYGSVCLALFAAVAIIQFRNAAVYPPTRGFDPIQHADYVRFVTQRWQIPDVSNGWEMSQPPLYYVLSAAVFTCFGGVGRERMALKAVQLITPFAMLGTLVLAWRLLVLLFPAQARMRALGFVVAALLPVGFYMSPQVTNEVFTALVISAVMVLAARQIMRRDFRWRTAVSLGLACGLALLSKYTGLFVFTSVLCLAGLRVVTGNSGAVPTASAHRRRLRHLAWACLLVAVTVSLCGWLYARNLKKFGHAFIGAWDKGSGFNIVQPPGYRTPAYYARFGAVFWHDPGRSLFSSFWDGMYASLWADPHRVFLNLNDPDAPTLSSLCLWLALLPSVAVVRGLSLTIRHLLTGEWDHPYFILLMTTVLTLTAVLTFGLEHPFYSNAKAHFALSLTPCAAVFAALGLETMCQRLGRLRWVVYLNLALLSAVVLYLFWYRGPW